MQRRESLRIVAGLAGVAALLAIASGCGTQGATATVSPAGAVRQAPSSSATPSTNTSPTPGPARPKLLPGAKTKALTAAGDRPYDKTFDDIRFEMTVGAPFRREMLTDAIEALAGQRIRIRGYILPTAQRSGIKQFVLVRDNQECCFGPGAALYDCILVEMQAGKTAEYSIRPVAVEGRFDIREVVGPDGKHWAIYRLDAESVR
jgi:hypothetical protein